MNMIRLSLQRLKCQRIVTVLVIFLTTCTMLNSINYLEDDKKNPSFRSKNLLTNLDKDESALDVQSRRKKLLRKYCRTFVDDYENLKVALLTDTNQTFAYCHVPKVASSAWMMFFAKINKENFETTSQEHGENENIHSLVMKKFSFHIKTQSDLAKRALFKFVFLRHPFERLVSAYFDKFVQDPDPLFVRSVSIGEPYDLEHVRHTFERLKEEEKQNGSVVEIISFKRFVKFVLHELKTGKISHGTFHWMPYSNFCGLCKIDYDFVGKIESLNTDLEDLKEHFPAEYGDIVDQILLTRKNASKGKSQITTLQYFSQLQKNYILRLYRSYKEDFDLGGYPYPGKYIDVGKINNNIKNV